MHADTVAPQPILQWKEQQRVSMGLPAPGAGGHRDLHEDASGYSAAGVGGSFG
ncbi:hypothetical protein GFS60_02958 [Rhodococcus sp. WAY2]|nr:hypothetical protein GFS60_02958 [Rhodococcus sp. WAY2]